LFAETRKATGKSNEKLYFVKVDVNACFDSIKHQILRELVSDLFSEKSEYIIQRYVVLLKSNGGQNVQKSFILRADAKCDAVPFSELALLLSDRLRNAILVDLAAQQSETFQEIVCLISQHVEENHVKVFPF
jgi:telomerase reverse transcriptase